MIEEKLNTTTYSIEKTKFIYQTFGFIHEYYKANLLRDQRRKFYIGRVNLISN